MLTSATEAVRWDAALNSHVISGYAEASQVLRGQGWSSDPSDNPLAPPEMRDMPNAALVFMNPPDHTRLRSLLSPAFTPRAIERLRPRVAAIVESVLAGLEDQDEAEILADVGQLVPLAVITELLDAGLDGARLFRDLTPDLFRLLEVNPTPGDLRAGIAASAELALFLTPLIAERSVRPGDDFISAMLTTPDGPTLEQVLATCLLLLAAGHETTANLITNGTYAVLGAPERREQFLTDPDRAMAELMRVHGSVKLVGRVAQTDHDIAGHRVRAGEAVLIRLDEVARDPRRLPDPDRLDLTRDPAPNLAFGAGAHYCLGAALSRVEVGETLTRLFHRFPRMALTEAPVQWRDSSTFHGLVELPVTLR
ncbi:cytochrome P450 [Spirillospora sp. CA-294931]|uniref:cytochrome P450 n=1 Tax=Spirillospora sp. CA-294931 TaxID=3240042 RepID=UPI003D8DC937